MKPFTPSRHFRRTYDHLFKKDPATANIFLLLAELANEAGQVQLGPCPEVELQQLMAARFNNPRAYQLPGGGPKR
ncbi:MAG: hypothetical protein WCW53_06885 [Syntrophales bacterium]|jgi:hypothetical protein|nr:hypothetical protein [Syntrophales bacterium]